MDGPRFDHWTVQVEPSLSRRRFGGVLAALGLGALLNGTAEIAARRKKKKKKQSCRNGTVKCGASCVDTETHAGHCGGCGQACDPGVDCVGGQCTPSGCGANEIDCGGGVCIPDVEHACCNQDDCGGPGQSIQGIVCNTTTHVCECELEGWGICQRFENKAGICGRCCPGATHELGEKCLSANDDLICVDETSNGCACPPDKPFSCTSANRVRCRASGNDDRACGGGCEDCTASGQVCCNGICVSSC